MPTLNENGSNFLVGVGVEEDKKAKKYVLCNPKLQFEYEDFFRREEKSEIGDKNI